MEIRKIIRVPPRSQTTQNLVISRCCFAAAKKCTNIYNARAQLLLCSSSKPFVWSRSRSRSRRDLLKLPIGVLSYKTTERRPCTLVSQTNPVEVELFSFLGHRDLIKNKTFTAIINMLNLYILIMTKCISSTCFSHCCSCLAFELFSYVNTFF